MVGFCFLTTDKNHNFYYASANLKDFFKQNIQDKNCFSYVSAPERSCFHQLVEHDIKTEGFFNGYMRLGSTPDYWFCDYGKRYDIDGNHKGYEGLIYSVAKPVSDYMTHFYQNL